MVMRYTIMSRSPQLHCFMQSLNSRSAIRFVSDKGKVLDDEERTRENLYIKKVEKEKLEKQKQKIESKEKLDKEKNDEKKP